MRRKSPASGVGRPSSKAHAFAAVTKCCEARGPALQATYRRIYSSAPAAFGRLPVVSEFGELAKFLFLGERLEGVPLGADGARRDVHFVGARGIIQMDAQHEPV